MEHGNLNYSETTNSDLGVMRSVTSSFSEKFVNRIYFDIKRYDYRLNYIPKEDCLQEIRFALLTARPEQIYRIAHRLIDNLLSDYGYSRKKGKDNFKPFYSEPEFSDDEKEMFSLQEEILHEIARR